MTGTRDARGPSDTVVVGVDGSAESLAAVDWAAEQARLEDRPLTIVHVATIGTLAAAHVDARTIAAVMQGEGRDVLARAGARAARHRVPDVRTDLRLDDPLTVLLHASRVAHLLVVGSRGRGPVAGLLLGSVGVALSRRTACPVVVHHAAGTPQPPTHPTGGRVLVGLDGPSDRVLEWGYQLAALRRLPMTVLGEQHVPGPLADPRELARRWGRQPVPVSWRRERGNLDEALLRLGGDSDVIVLGSHLRHSVLGLLDRNAAPGVVERASCTVAVVPDRD